MYKKIVLVLDIFVHTPKDQLTAVPIKVAGRSVQKHLRHGAELLKRPFAVLMCKREENFVLHSFGFTKLATIIGFMIDIKSYANKIMFSTRHLKTFLEKYFQHNDTK